MASDNGMALPRRILGKTGIEVSVLGLGGFHQVEIDRDSVAEIVSEYLAAGGNYIETARGYGAGASETKLGQALRGVPRESYVLASKSGAADRESAWREIHESLERLGTDYLDLYFFHGVGSEAHLNAICSPDGALAAFAQARDEGLIRHLAFSSHWPEMYLRGAECLPIDAVLIWGNYLDFCSYPEIPRRVLPGLREKGIGVLFMKPLGDGILYRSPERAFRYALGHAPDCMVSGFNSLDMLRTDLEICLRSDPVLPAEMEAVLRDAPELGDYVCRQCDTCAVLPGPAGDRLKRVFELEGKVDRQMDDARPVPVADYALRERLKGWFGNGDRARALFSEEFPEGRGVVLGADASACRYGLGVARKLAIAEAKLVAHGKLRYL